MSDSGVLDKYIGRIAEGGMRRTAGEPVDHEEYADDLGSFGWLRGVRERAMMLELRKKDGNILAVSYSWLERIEFDPSVGITLIVGGRQVRIMGRNLNGEVRPNVRLFEGIVRHRVPWVRQAVELALSKEHPAETVVESIG
ncbi:MAG TPA: hypothetical protein VGN12_19580 [Pirellulales bacterium]|jgi:hypothetical protein